jgi:hypothetical protein
MGFSSYRRLGDHGSKAQNAVSGFRQCVERRTSRVPRNAKWHQAGARVDLNQAARELAAQHLTVECQVAARARVPSLYCD